MSGGGSSAFLYSGVVIKFQVEFLNWAIGKQLFGILGVFSLCLPFIPFCDFSKLSPYDKALVPLYFVIFCFLVYVCLWIRANKMRSLELHINNSRIIVRYGDLFKCEGLKVIPFNERFDTQVDNIVISENTLNGIFLKKYATDLTKVSEVLTKTKEQKGVQRRNKKCCCPLGTIASYEDYLLVAFSKFDENNCANLNMQDYWQCLLNFWHEADIVYAGKNIHVPLMGSGITRFKRQLNPQDLLEFLILSFKVSGWQIPHNCTIGIVLSPGIQNQINLFRLKEFYNGL